MEVIFKDVGQGDSIVLTWQKDDGTEGIGLIDCCKKDRQNPTLQHLQDAGIKQIDFIIWTHPHSDHYSGMFELLTYCEKQDIKIGIFWNTCNLFMTSAHYKRVLATYVKENDPLNGKEIDRLYLKLKQLRNSGIIINYEIPVGFPKYPLNQESKLSFLAPHIDEQESFIQYLEKNPNRTEGSVANLFSTVTFIELGDNCVLLCSDAPLSVFERLIGNKAFLGKKLLLGQLPHHGSIANHSIAFWRSLKHDSNTPLAISVGMNTYNHPSEKVINELSEEFYKVYLTTPMALLQKKHLTKTLVLDTDIFTEEFILSSDLKFELVATYGIAKIKH